MSPKKHLTAFYAVTKSDQSKSVWKATIYTNKKEHIPKISKIKLEGESKATVGTDFTNGDMLCVMDRLQLFVPEGGGITSFQTDAVMVNTRYHGGFSSLIVALFLRKQDAERCFAKKNLKAKDPRWKKQTIEVLRSIGAEHPFCSISKADPRWYLYPKEDWMGAENKLKKAA